MIMTNNINLLFSYAPKNYKKNKIKNSKQILTVHFLKVQYLSGPHWVPISYVHG